MAVSKAWSAKDNALLKTLWFENTPIAEIAKRFGRSSIAIQTRGCKLFGKNSRVRAERTGDTRYGWCTTENIEDLRKRWLGNYTIQQIADHFDISDTAVRRAAKQHLGDDWVKRKPRTSATYRKIAVLAKIDAKQSAPLSPFDAEHAAWYKMAKERNKQKRAVLEMKWRKLNEAL